MDYITHKTPITELQEMRYRYFLDGRKLSDASCISRESLWAYETGRMPMTPKLLQSLVKGYEKLGFKSAKWHLYDIFERGNPRLVEAQPVKVKYQPLKTRRAYDLAR